MFFQGNFKNYRNFLVDIWPFEKNFNLFSIDFVSVLDIGGSSDDFGSKIEFEMCGGSFEGRKKTLDWKFNKIFLSSDAFIHKLSKNVKEVQICNFIVRGISRFLLKKSTIYFKSLKNQSSSRKPLSIELWPSHAINFFLEVFFSESKITTIPLKIVI